MKNAFALASRRVIATSLILAIGVSGCATMKQYGGTTEESGGCNAAATALIGAVLGALIAGKNNRNTGAVVGGAVGGLACLAWNYRSKQTKTAEQVNEAYKAANSGILPAQPQVVKYDVKSASSVISSGSPIVIDSTIEVVGGAAGSVPPVVEQQLIVSHDGKVISKATKRANNGQGAGAYSTSFTVSMPAGVPQGRYPVTTALLLNGKQVEQKNVDVQIVMTPAREMIASILK